MLAADRLRDAIVAGRTPPGARLIEASLASELELSRGTVRAALQQLVAEGLVTQRPYAGWQVVSVTAHDAWELYTLRSRLEALAAGLAAERSDAGGRARLKDAFERLRAAARSEHRQAISDADFDLHKTIVSLSGHSRLEIEFAHVEKQVRMYIASTNALISVDRRVVENHSKLVQAILDADVGAAEKIACRHSLAAGVNLVNHLEKKTDHSGSIPRANVSDRQIEAFVYRWNLR